MAVATAGVAAAYVIITTPPLRRLASRAVRVWLGMSVPAFLAGEIRQAWTASASRAQPSP